MHTIVYHALTLHNRAHVACGLGNDLYRPFNQRGFPVTHGLPCDIYHQYWMTLHGLPCDSFEVLRETARNTGKPREYKSFEYFFYSKEFWKKLMINKYIISISWISIDLVSIIFTNYCLKNTFAKKLCHRETEMCGALTQGNRATAANDTGKPRWLKGLLQCWYSFKTELMQG